MEVAVIGSGVIGISTALALAECQPDVRITVIADGPFDRTTSAGPAGFYRPHGTENSRWSGPTGARLRELWTQQPATVTGVHAVSGYRFDDSLHALSNEEAAGCGHLLNFRYLPRDELDMFNSKPKHGVFYTTYCAQGRHYVPYLKQQLTQRGVHFQHSRVDSFAQLAAYDYVFNCAGLGARELTGDTALRPKRGVLIEVDTPWIRHFMYNDHQTYMIPGINSWFLGGLKQLDRSDRQITDVDRQDIWRRCLHMMPTLKGARVLGEWCGLRPSRGDPEIPRVEFERLATANGPVKVVHNYGHGGQGFILSWGSALHATELWHEAHRGTAKL